MKFEYDESKSILNGHKHGISLEEAQSLWEVPHIQIAARTQDEPRGMIVGLIAGKAYSCIFTLRGEVIRLISARRSRINEENIYYEHTSRKESDSQAV